jgi:hypothetical protein
MIKLVAYLALLVEARFQLELRYLFLAFVDLDKVHQLAMLYNFFFLAPDGLAKTQHYLSQAKIFMVVMCSSKYINREH